MIRFHPLPSALLLSFLCWHGNVALAQTDQPHARHHAQFKGNAGMQESQFDRTLKLDSTYVRKRNKKCLPQKEVYGWHPSWSGTAYLDYDYPLLGTLSYFAYVVNPNTGSYSDIGQWRSSPVVDSAFNGSSKVDLTVACFGENAIATLLSKPNRIATLRDSIVAVLLARDADGVCLDFEGLGSSQRDNFTNMVKMMADTLHKLQPARRLTMTLPALDPSSAFDLLKLNSHVDRFALMAYDFHYSGSKTTGPVAPLDAVETAIARCLKGGIPAAKVLLGVPYYGYEWPSTAAISGSKTTGPGTAVTLRNVSLKAQGMTEEHHDSIPWWSSVSPVRQLWAEDSLSMDIRFGLVKKHDLAGIAIWTLGYDHGLDTYWNLIKRHFYDCSAESTGQADFADSPAEIPGSGVSSAERNTYNWVWMLAGGAVAILIMLMARRMLR